MLFRSAEDWASESIDYDENIVIPVYVKSTNTFDPRNNEHIKRLVTHMQETRPFDPFYKKIEIASEFGFFDWSYFEAPSGAIPTTEKKSEYFKSYRYPILKAIIDMGFDGIWVKEKALGVAGVIEKYPKDRVEDLDLIRRTDDKSMESQTISTLREDVDKYNQNSVWNHLAFRTDAIKSAMNTGKFESRKNPKKMEISPLAYRYLNQVTKNNRTGWNEFEKDGRIYASYDSPENLVTYSFADTASLDKANI